MDLFDYSHNTLRRSFLKEPNSPYWNLRVTPPDKMRMAMEIAASRGDIHFSLPEKIRPVALGECEKHLITFIGMPAPAIGESYFAALVNHSPRGDSRVGSFFLWNRSSESGKAELFQGPSAELKASGETRGHYVHDGFDSFVQALCGVLDDNISLIQLPGEDPNLPETSSEPNWEPSRQGTSQPLASQQTSGSKCAIPGWIDEPLLKRLINEEFRGVYRIILGIICLIVACVSFYFALEARSYRDNYCAREQSEHSDPHAYLRSSFFYQEYFGEVTDQTTVFEICMSDSSGWYLESTLGYGFCFAFGLFFLWGLKVRSGLPAIVRILREQRNQVAWVYPSRTDMNGTIFHKIHLGLASGRIVEVTAFSEADLTNALNQISFIVPWATYGYSEELKKQFYANPKSLYRSVPSAQGPFPSSGMGRPLLMGGASLFVIAMFIAPHFALSYQIAPDTEEGHVAEAPPEPPGPGVYFVLEDSLSFIGIEKGQVRSIGTEEPIHVITPSKNGELYLSATLGFYRYNGTSTKKLYGRFIRPVVELANGHIIGEGPITDHSKLPYGIFDGKTWNQLSVQEISGNVISNKEGSVGEIQDILLTKTNHLYLAYASIKQRGIAHKTPENHWTYYPFTDLEIGRRESYINCTITKTENDLFAFYNGRMYRKVGREFEKIPTKRAIVASALEDRQGNILVLGGRYEGRVRHRNSIIYQFKNNRLKKIKEYRNREIHSANLAKDGGVYIVVKDFMKTDSIDHVMLDGTSNQILPEDHSFERIRGMTTDEKGRIWFWSSDRDFTPQFSGVVEDGVLTTLPIKASQIIITQGGPTELPENLNLLLSSVAASR